MKPLFVVYRIASQLLKHKPIINQMKAKHIVAQLKNYFEYILHAEAECSDDVDDEFTQYSTLTVE